jgi:hypothetical protein
LLTAPLQPAAIVDGQCKALLAQFRTVWLTVFLLDTGLCAGSFTVSGWTVPATVIYLLAWAMMLTYWFAVHLETASRAMWISAWTGRAAYAALHSIGRILWLLFLLWVLSRGVTGMNVPTRAMPFLLIIVVVLYFAAFFSFARRHTLREKLTRELRLIACAPIPSRGDKRFKKWDPDLIFPPGRWGELLLVPGQSKHPRSRRKATHAMPPPRQAGAPRRHHK